MEIRLLQSFMAIAEEGSITRAAEILHITQPALSRQLVALEAELGCELFHRGKRRMELTDEGLLLQRRASEILSLVALTQEELSDHSAELEGTVSIGAGELSAMRELLGVVEEFSQAHPLVRFDFYTGVADQVAERLSRGLLDFGLLLEPVDTERYDILPMRGEERWVAVVQPGDPLCAREAVSAADLAGRTMVLPNRAGVQSVLGGWFGSGFDAVDSRFTTNLGGSAARLVESGLAVFVGVEGCVDHWDPERFVVRPLTPPFSSRTVLAWKQGLPHTAAVQAFLELAQKRLRSEG